MKFTKMQGAGNDYIYVNCFQEKVEHPSETAIAVSDRHFGVGADGLVLIGPSAKADFFMDIYNADGSRAKMCGNATRCVAKYVYDNGMTKKTDITLETRSGIKQIHMELLDKKVHSATVNMGKPELAAEKIPTRFDTANVISQKLTIEGEREETYPVTCLSMGNPHCVVFTDTPTMALPLSEIGPKFEHHPMFPDRVNTEFVRVLSEHEIEMRVWERGSGETLACGTGACAAAVASVLNGFCVRKEEIKVRLRGGILYILWQEDGSVLMRGPANTVCTGEIDLATCGKNPEKLSLSAEGNHANQ